MEEIIETTNEAVQEVLHLGLLSLLPIAVIFMVCVITKRSLLGLFCGLITASIIVAANTASSFAGVFFQYTQGTLGNEDFQWIATVILLFGAMTALFEESGAVDEFGFWISKFIKTKRQALAGTYLLGLIIFIDDYLSALSVGFTMRKITDKHKIPRSQLAFIVIVTGGAVSQIVPISSWTAVYATFFKDQDILYNGSAMGAFLHSIPYIYYAWVLLVVCLLQIIGVLPKLGMLKRDYKRAEETGALFPQGCPETAMSEAENEAQKTQIAEAGKSVKKRYPFNFLIPIAATVAVTVLSDFDILQGAFWGTACAFVLFLVQRKLSFYKLLDACFHGAISMAYVIAIFVFAYTINALNAVTGMAPFVVSCVEPILNGSLLLVMAFLVTGIYSFLAGGSWDVIMILMPIVMPLSIALGIDPIIAGAAVFSGFLYGNILCPYSDEEILASQASQIRTVDTVFAIAPYMIIVGIITVIMYLVTGFIIAT